MIMLKQNWYINHKGLAYEWEISKGDSFFVRRRRDLFIINELGHNLKKNFTEMTNFFVHLCSSFCEPNYDIRCLVPQMINCSSKQSHTLWAISTHHTLAVHQCNDRIIQPLQFHVLSNLFGLLRSFPVRLWLCDMSVVNWKTKGMQLSFMRTNSVKFIESNPVRMASISLRHILNTWWSSIIMLNSPCLTLHSKKFIGKASLSHQEMDIIPDL